MKTLAIVASLALLGSCRHSFELVGPADFSIHRVPGVAPDSSLRRFTDGVYVLKICEMDTVQDGHRITIFGSCPDSQLTSAALNKTIYLIFFDQNRVVYYSANTLLEMPQEVRRANDLRSTAIALDQRRNRSREMLRGYYTFVPGPLSRDRQSFEHVAMQLERGDGEDVRLLFRREPRPGRTEPALVLVEAGISERNAYDLANIDPAMKLLDQIFHVRFEFFFCDTIQPRLISREQQSVLWPPGPEAAGRAETARKVSEVARW